MAYQVDKFNGQFLVSVDDGSIDTTTDLRLVGKNYAGYGELQNENFVHLMENFANTTPPPKALVGQLWYDSGLKKLRFYDGSRYKVAGGAEIGPTPPSGLGIGEFWWDTSAKQLYAWSGTDFELVGPEASSEFGQSTIVSQVVKDILGNNHTILKTIVAGKTVSIISQTEFKLDTILNPIEGFTQSVNPNDTDIKKGITLVNTSISGISTDDYVYWGTASNALKLGGVDADQFIQRGNVIFNESARFGDPGFTVGDDEDFRIRVENGDDVIIENRLGNEISVRIGSLLPKISAVFDSNGIMPGDSNSNLGTSSALWNFLYASNISVKDGNITLLGTAKLLGDTQGTHKGNVEAEDTTVLIDAENKVIGSDNAQIRGNLFGSVTGNLTGTASNATRLSEYDPSIPLPTASNKTSVVVRDSEGKIYVSNIIGISSSSEKLRINDAATDPAWDPAVESSLYRSAKTTKTAYTIAARDANGDISANLFKGTATAAQYADLAEKYLADKEYETGTVMVIGGEKEVTASSSRYSRAIGVVSANPAYMMNSELEGGTYIALKGRVPVKVVGKVNKGDYLTAIENGCAEPGGPAFSFAIALESSEDTEVKLIEAVIL